MERIGEREIGRTFPQMDTRGFLEAQQMAADTAVRFTSVFYDYALALNRAWLDLWAKRINQYSTWPQRLAECASPTQFMSTQADFMEQAFHDYQEGFQRIADVGGEAAREMGKAIKESEKATERAAEHVGRAGSEALRGMKEAQKNTQRAGQPGPV